MCNEKELNLHRLIDIAADLQSAELTDAQPLHCWLRAVELHHVSDAYETPCSALCITRKCLLIVERARRFELLSFGLEGQTYTSWQPA